MVKKILCNSKGSAGLLAFIIMISLSVVGIGMIRWTTQDIKDSRNYNEGVKAQLAAEAGVQVAFAHLQNDSSKLDSLSAQPLDTGSSVTYEYTSTQSGNVYTVTSTGKANDSKGSLLAKRTVRARIEVTSANNNHVNGPAAINGELKSDSSQNVGTGATATQTVNSGGVLDKVTFKEDPKFSFPSYKYGTWTPTGKDLQDGIVVDTGKTKTLPGNAYYFNGAISIKGTLKVSTPTTIYAHGGVSLDSCSIEGPLTIIAFGDINSNPNVNITSDINLFTTGNINVNGTLGGKVTAYAQGNITFNSDACANADLTAGGTVTICTGSVITGRVCCNGLTLESNSQLTLSPPPGGSSGSIKITSWEKYHG